jgi:hypothetical protein
MILVLIFLLATVICFGFLVYSRTEKYRLLGQLDVVKKIEEVKSEGIRNVKKRLTGGAKYDYGSDYDKIKQKRPIGSIRGDGQDT